MDSTCRRWRIIAVPIAEALDSDLSHDELIALSIAVSIAAGRGTDEKNVQYRAWTKMQPQVQKAVKER